MNKLMTNPSGYICTITKDDIETNFIVDGWYTESYDKETGCSECEYEITDIWLHVKDNDYVLIHDYILDDKVYEDLSEQFIEQYKNGQPSKQDIKDIVGDTKYHQDKEDGKI